MKRDSSGPYYANALRVLVLERHLFMIKTASKQAAGPTDGRQTKSVSFQLYVWHNRNFSVSLNAYHDRVVEESSVLLNYFEKPDKEKCQINIGNGDWMNLFVYLCVGGLYKLYKVQVVVAAVVVIVVAKLPRNISDT